MAQICERVAAMASEAVLRAMAEQYQGTSPAACIKARLEELRGPTATSSEQRNLGAKSESSQPPNLSASESSGIRNPFGVADVADPYGEDVRRLAATTRLGGGGGDRNAPQWAPRATDDASGELDGEWYSRWAVGTFGIAKIRLVGDRLFALYTDDAGRMAGRTWILEAVREGGGNRLVGRWVQVGNLRDTGPFVGLIVNNERIDGIWNWRGTERWDFRRELKQ
jgi:hypothetical protein